MLFKAIKTATLTLTSLKPSLFAVLLASILAPTISHAESGIENLSPELRALLSKEMLALQDGMQRILPAYVSGDLNEVADIATKMKNSFILKQEITPKQKKELKAKLPKHFLHFDKKFHEQAGMLAHVAEEKHTELVSFYYYKLTESCVGCHTHFAKHKFPKLGENSHKKAHHH